MRIYIKRENVSQGIWMDLPASQEEIEQIYMELKDMDPSSMIPFIARVESDIQPLAGCLEDCTAFEDGHMELLNELARDMVVWENDERARFGAVLLWDHPDTIETVMDVARHLDGYFQPTPCRSKGKGYEPNTGCLLSVYMVDENWNREIFQLPLTEQERVSQAVRKWDVYAIHHTSGYLGELPCYLPPGITLSDLDRVTNEINREVIRKGILEKEKLYAILEAGLPKTIEEASEIIQGYENHVYIPAAQMDHKDMARSLALPYARMLLPEGLKPFFCHEKNMKSHQERYMVSTSTGYVFHLTRDYSHRLSEHSTIRLYSPLTVSVFRNDRDGFMPEILSGNTLIKQTAVIEAALKRYLPSYEECLGAFLDNRLLRAKVERMIPRPEVYDGQLWCVLEAGVKGTLTEAEHEELKGDWLRQMKEGWGMALLEYPIHTEEGEMHIGLWDEDYGTALCIKTEEKLKGPDLPGQKTGKMEPHM
ncbi:MAG: hypothetical protein LUK37_22525 [Clostridia bacterium]|nr:hypothetical protein [Clostridia bacterium]